LIVYQVKYVRNPWKLDDPHKWLTEVMEAEAPKVAALLPRNVAQYYLVTNIAGTAHLDSGSVDKLQQILASSMAPPAMALWRDDLDRRVEQAPMAIRWAYPEITRGTEVLELLVDSDLGENRRRRLAAIKSFLADQFDRDEEVRFKQVELQNDLLSLFIDVPAVVTKSPGTRRQRYRDDAMIANLFHGRDDPFDTEFWFEGGPQTPVGAAKLLLHEGAQDRFQFCVVEGAPGQGKSTLAQFVCQIYRMKIRGVLDLPGLDLELVPTRNRLPIRVDLTEYAAWINGIDPFISGDEGESRTRSGSKQLEAFVAALISNGSGGAGFLVEDLHAILRSSSVLLVLDGLDEVAETRLRDSVIKHINAATKRLSELSPDIQVVVTTRPSAFSGVSEFSPKTFHTLQLVSLGTKLIADYARRWTDAKRIDARDAARIRRGLQSRLAQPHVRDLARNPMQLAILLSVIHSRGESLPDKRTALYDIYVELFLARESEKTAEVREHNELLIDVHQYLAYHLHSRAEADGALGRISLDSLMGVLREYLRREGRDPALADDLFQGAQRVVFLVARVEGTFEFEVQPLREYFAGKYLYLTSPYSPPGNEQGGTMPDRFDALCRNPYWLNVTRFFAGSLSKGELPALVDRLQALSLDEGFASIAYPRFLAATLLSDWVFSQHQRSVQAVVDIVLDGAGLRELFRRATSARRDLIVLPSGAGRAEFVQSAFKTLNEISISGVSRGLTQMLSANASRDEMRDEWRRWFDNASAAEKPRWIAVGRDLGVLRSLDARQLTRIATEATSSAVVAQLYLGKRFDVLSASGDLFDRLIEAILDGKAHKVPYVDEEGLGYLLTFLSGGARAVLYEPFLSMESSFRHASIASAQHRGRGKADELRIPRDSKFKAALQESLQQLEQVSERSLEDWRHSVGVWSRVVEPLRLEFGYTRMRILRVALMAALAADGLSAEQRRYSLLDHSKDLCVRLRNAKLRAGNVRWWTDEFARVSNSDERCLVLAASLFMAGQSVIVELASEIDRHLRMLSPEEMDLLISVLDTGWKETSAGAPRRKILIDSLPSSLSDRGLAFVAIASPGRVQREIIDRRYRDYSGSDEFGLAFAIRGVVHGILRGESGSGGWDELYRLIQLNPKNRFLGSVGFVGQINFARSRNSLLEMNAEFARKVLDDDSMPDGIISLASQVCETDLFERSEPLARVADRERWFDNL